MKGHSRFIIALSLSTLCSGTGIAAFFTFAYWYIVIIGGSSIYASIANISTDIVILLLLPIIGKLTDSVSKKVILSTLYIIGLFLSLIGFCVFYLFGNTAPNTLLPTLLVIIFINFFTIIRTFDQIARTAYFKVQADNNMYQSGNRILEGIRQGVTFISGGVTILVMGIGAHISIIFSLLSVMFILGALIQIFLPYDKIDSSIQLMHTTDSHNQSMMHRFTQKFLSGFPVLLNTLDPFSCFLIILSILPYILVVSLNVTYPMYFHNISDNPTYYAALTIPYGLGALLAAFTQKNEARSFYSMFCLYSILFILFLLIGFIYANIFVSYLVLFMLAYCHSSIRIHRNTYMMNIINAREIGSVLGVFEIIFTIGVVFFSLALGYFTDLLSAGAAWMIVAVIYTAFLIVLAFTKQIKRSRNIKVT